MNGTLACCGANRTHEGNEIALQQNFVQIGMPLHVDMFGKEQVFPALDEERRRACRKHVKRFLENVAAECRNVVLTRQSQEALIEARQGADATFTLLVELRVLNGSGDTTGKQLQHQFMVGCKCAGLVAINAERPNNAVFDNERRDHE